MAKVRGKAKDDYVVSPLDQLTKVQAKAMATGFYAVEEIGRQIEDIVMLHATRIFELEKVLEHYAKGPDPALARRALRFRHPVTTG